MIVNTIGQTAIISQEVKTLDVFLDHVMATYKDYEMLHIVLHLLTDKMINNTEIDRLVALAATHKAAGKSFVVVTDMLTYDQVPDGLELVPTLQEAKDVIEMEDIERDLGI
jgi:hypothetical protein